MKHYPTFGYCSHCKTIHSLAEGPAHKAALSLFETLKKEQRLDFEIPLAQANPLFSTKPLYNERCGQMFGVLVGVDRRGEHVILKAFSSQHSGEWSVAGWVEPLVPSKEYLQKMRTGAKEITTLTAQLVASEEDGSINQELRITRKNFSRSLMKELHGMYRLHNFKGESCSLDEAFIVDESKKQKGGMPTGTGDCCAPKLLNAAAQQGITPLGLSEFFLGGDSPNGSKTEGVFYPACENKCQPILGYLLCGIENQSPRD